MTVENIALSSAEGEMTLHVPGAGPSPGATLEMMPGKSYRDERVAVTTLDDYFHKNRWKISFIKIDVEGHELALLEGGRALLERDRPFLLIECEQRHHPSDSMLDVFTYLARLRYQGHFYLGGRQIPIHDFEPSSHQVAGGVYVNNFIFEPQQPASGKMGDAGIIANQG